MHRRSRGSVLTFAAQRSLTLHGPHCRSEENDSDGLREHSKGDKEPTLEGPLKAEGLCLKVTKRTAYDSSGHRWPAGRTANIVPVIAVETAQTPAEKG